jgi:periplasmic protein TonB
MPPPNPNAAHHALTFSNAAFSWRVEVLMVTQVAGKRPLGVVGRAGLVVGMHAAVLFAIAQGFVLKDKADLPDPLVGTIIDKPPIIDIPPPVGPVDPRPHTDIYVPPPVGPIIDTSEQPAEGAISGTTETPPPTGAGSAVPVPNIVGVHQLARGLTQPPYPSFDRRNGHEGTAEIEVYVLPNGRVGDARIVTSTGFEGLDRSALQEARTHWRFGPATRDGVPFAQWYRLRVKFRLEDAR